MKICSRCDTKKDDSEFGYKKGKILQAYCKDCQKIYQSEWYLKNREKKISQAIVNKKKHRDWFIEYKSQLSCEMCGENHIATLDFHHKNPEEKEFQISTCIDLYGKPRLLEEISKCSILCSNCHRKLHYEMRKELK